MLNVGFVECRAPRRVAWRLSGWCYSTEISETEFHILIIISEFQIFEFQIFEFRFSNKVLYLKPVTNGSRFGGLRPPQLTYRWTRDESLCVSNLI